MDEALKVKEYERLELKRKLIHLLNGSTIAYATYYLLPIIGKKILWPLIIALALMHVMPKITPKLRLMNELMRHFERKKDINSFPFKGAIFFGYGITFPILLLDGSYAVAIILILSVGDSFSNLIGRRFGKHKIGDKSLEGALGFASTAWIASSFLINPAHSLILSIFGAFIELLSFADDNLTIPSGLTLLALLLIP